MHDPLDVDEDVVNYIALMGARRCVNNKKNGSSVLPPAVDPEDVGRASRERLLFNQAQQMGIGFDGRDGHYVELLLRAQALVEFFEENVGEDKEWPIIIWGETDEAVMCLEDMVDGLRSSVNCLMCVEG